MSEDATATAASPQPRTPTRTPRSGLHIEVSSATRAPRPYNKRGAFAVDDHDDTESERIKTLKESFIGSHGRLRTLTLLYVQQDINESFTDSEHVAVALMWSGSGVGKTAKDYKIKKKVSMLGNAFEGIFTRFYGERPPNILVEEGKFFIEKNTWFMYNLCRRTTRMGTAGCPILMSKVWGSSA